MRLRIVTINVQNNEGDPGRPGLLNAELRRLAPDVVALQEVVDDEHLGTLLEGTGLHGTHQSAAMAYAPPFADRYGGNAVATRWPHHVAEVLDPRVAGAKDVPWCTVAVKVPVPGEGDVLFISATASWRLDAEAVREQQAVALSDLDARHRTDLPTIIAGDFNAEPDAASIRYLTGRQSISGRSVHYHDAWAVAGDGPGHTWSDENANAAALFDQIVRQPGHRRRLDYVFIGSWHAHPKARCEIRSANLAFDQPTDGVWPSDHYGVVVDVEIGKDR
ncbi:endonuclease/exonuclease/phosphatase family metal-dependent hydrolase [Nocardia tenerifensis]|uniref:Endonuclease/exonuclease/phosphatase family metal-dependent hydrolase n=1 Tax=Nocardia tenerifensis TaxID=228006 RepID=A0A318K7U1_9NOCA|nr:endonuclease/exonuclease/phosphatase family protein [Nocardia tenerifensis]PXX65516.1 endonuclease/exonuclease/phosphatase family metal-dependent hydrolase [Nocardia tenerifensis]